MNSTRDKDYPAFLRRLGAKPGNPGPTAQPIRAQEPGSAPVIPAPVSSKPPPPTPPASTSGSSGGGIMGDPFIRMVAAVVLAIAALLSVILILASINDYFVAKALESAAKYKQMTSGTSKALAPAAPAEQISAELRLSPKSHIVVQGPAKKLVIDSAHRITAWRGDFKVYMDGERANTFSWTPGYSSNPPQMTPEEFFGTLKRLSGRTANPQHRFWIVVKDDQYAEFFTE